MKGLKKILINWILPAGVVDWFRKLKDNRNQKLFRKYWRYVPVKGGMHDVPFFTNNKKEPFWLSLNQEARPSIMFKKQTTLLIDLEHTSNYLHIGVGQPECQKASDVRVFINGVLVSEIGEMDPSIWHDIKIPVSQFEGQVCIKIDETSDSQTFLSHPIICSSKKRFSMPKNIVCIILDALIHADFEQEDGRITPNINNFFSDATICSQVYSQGDWTLPAFSSMLTGVYPINHGCYNPDQQDSALPDKMATLPQCLLSGSYRTFGYSSHTRFNPAYGHAKGFERFIFRPRDSENYHIQIIDQAISHLEAYKNESNFIFLHFFDTHAPYYPSSFLQNTLMSPFRHCGAYVKAKKEGINNYIGFLRDQRKAKLREIDLALSCLFSYLKTQAWFNEATVILTADHGIPFRHRNMPLLTQNRVHIPLLVKSPLQKSKREGSFIEGNVDLMPSILHIAEIFPPRKIDGRPWPFLGGEKRTQVFSESLYENVYEASIRDDLFCFHFHCPFDKSSGEIYIDQKDVDRIFKRHDGNDVEKENLAHSHPDLVKRYSSLILNHITAAKEFYRS